MGQTHSYRPPEKTGSDPIFSSPGDATLVAMDVAKDDESLGCRPDRCPWCGHVGVPVAVHGHLQCERCGINVDPCCGGERATDDEAREDE